MNAMSEDAKTILLLCGYLGGESGADPLNQRDYTLVVRWLRGKNLRPSDLLVPGHVPFLARETGLEEQRLTALLKRGVLLGFAVERWNQSGIWVICRSDSDYPKRYREHLKDKAPPILFGAGDRTLLQGGGFAIVGSRDVDAEGETFARAVAVQCACGGMPVVSGGARGVDQIAMASALEAGGIVLGVLADTLLRRSVSRDARGALADGRLLLISPYHPEAGFNVGNAMGRNKLIYALADYGLVVSSDYNKGGTWEGAVEELKREPSLPVFVRTGPTVPKGNLELLHKGARAFPSDGLMGNLLETIERAISKTTKPVVDTSVTSQELPLLMTPLAARKLVDVKATKQLSVRMSAIVRETAPDMLSASGLVAGTVLHVVKPLILGALDKPMSVEKLAKALDVRKVQMQDWVAALVSEGILVEIVKRKAKMVAIRNPDEEFRLG